MLSPARSEDEKAKGERFFPLDSLISGPLPEHAILSEGKFSPTHLVLSTYHSSSLRDLNRSIPWLIPGPIKLTAKFNHHANAYYYNKKQCIEERHTQCCWLFIVF